MRFTEATQGVVGVLRFWVFHCSLGFFNADILF